MQQLNIMAIVGSLRSPSVNAATARAAIGHAPQDVAVSIHDVGGLPLYNGAARALHCRGLGTCGTCAVTIEGEVSELTTIERVRLELPPHGPETGLRLACQCKILGDLVVTKHPGFFGSRVEKAD